MKYLSRNLLIMILALASGGCLLVMEGCNEDKENPPLAYIDITILPNSTLYQELNVIGGWMYLDESDGVVAPSRGLIVYRWTPDQFLAYDRTPPYKADSCCNTSKTKCTKLVVEDFTYVVDTCTESKFLLINGAPFSGPATTFLYTYVTEYDGYTLYIHN